MRLAHSSGCNVGGWRHGGCTPVPCPGGGGLLVCATISDLEDGHMVKDIGHFIGGKHVKGTSGRFADVFNPNTGEVQARVALASPAELRAAVENATAAQPEWAAKNPQVRARVMMRFLELARVHAEEIAKLISMEHGKTIPDALGDLQRGVEVVEFACGIPHLLKGEY